MNGRAIEGVDYYVYVVPFPPSVHGVVVTNPDGTFSVYLNANDTRERQRKAAEHEKRHIENNDFAKSDVVEAEEEHEKN